MRVGVVNQETWSFLGEIYEDLQKNYSTSLFQWRVKNYPILNSRLNTLSINREMGKFLRSNDVVFFEWASEFLSIASHLPRRCGIVTRLHRYEMYEQAAQINWERVDKIILVSQAKRREFLLRFPDLAGKIEIVYEAVDPEKFAFNHKMYQGDIGILCQLIPRKRVYELVLAFSELVKAQPRFHLHIGGGPHPEHLDYYAALLDLVQQLGLQDQVTFYGLVSEPAKWYKNIDIFISNSYSEGLQVAPMEAMASGCYCLSHHWDGAEELLPEPYLYYTDRQMLEKILAYSGATKPEKDLEKKNMRSIVCEKFNIHHTKEQIRRVIASAA
jgi:glycosyltransferase involved in cell wall biosynthesis